MTRVRGLVGAVAAGMALMVVGATPALADTLDQQAAWDSTQAGSVDSAWVYGGQDVAQSFTAGMTGDLTRIQVDLNPGDARTASGLTLSIYEAPFDAVAGNSFPTGTALASTTIGADVLSTMHSDQWGPRDTITATFTTPAAVTAGTTYAIVAHSADGQMYKWFAADVRDDLSTYGPGTSWNTWIRRLVFSTYVDGSLASRTGGASSGSDPATGGLGRNTFPLTLQAQGGPSAVEAKAEVDPGWVQLPGVGTAEKSDRAFLGWSTSPNFPVEHAREQVAKGWGAVDEVLDGERMILIPAGGFTEVTGPTKLYAIWG